MNVLVEGFFADLFLRLKLIIEKVKVNFLMIRGPFKIRIKP